MRYIHLIAFGLLLIVHSSCVRHQFYSFTSDKLPLTLDNGFVDERAEDSVRIMYKWQNNTAYVEVQNLSNQMIQIDWSRSALVFNDVKQDVYNQTAQTASAGTFAGSSLQWSNGGITTFDGNIALNANTGSTTSQNAVFPRSKSVYELPDPVLRYYKYGGTSTNTPLKPRKVTLPAQGGLRLKELSFDKTNTPLKMRCYLAYQTANSPTVRQVEHEFWVHQVVETYNRETMDKLQNTTDTKGLDKNLKNKFIRSKRTHFNTFAQVTSVLGFIGGLVWIGLTAEPSE